MRGSDIAAALIGAALVLILAVIFVGTPKDKMQVFGFSFSSPETMVPAVRVENIGVHGIIGDGPHTHGAMTAEQQAADQEQHTKVEQSIFFSPGGYYTKEDIAKNGPLSPSQKFKDLMSRHDLKPKVGDYLCPITNTKANEAFPWWVGGKKYLFCCPPCVEEFVLNAKKGHAPKDPQDYVKR